MPADLHIDRLTPAIGAEISGVDLGKRLDAVTHDAVYQALLDNLVIFFRDQNISPQRHLDFAQGFGELDQPHPVYPHVPDFPHIMMLANDVKTPPDTNCWHTDLTYKQEPAFASILVAREVPETGGDTLWSSLYAAYDALPQQMKSYLADLNAVHEMGDFRNNFTVGETSTERLNAAMQRFGTAIHPIVQHHPVTGRPFLYVNRGFTQHVIGMGVRESSKLLDYLFSHVEQPEFQLRFRWTKNTVAMWDNRVTMHYAVADYLPAYRCMNRITVVKDRRAAARAQAA